MKKSATLFLLVFASVLISTVTSCREKSTSEKIEDGIEEVGDGLEEAAEDVKDEIEDATDDN